MTTCGDAGSFADGARAGARPGHRGDADSAEVPPGGSRVPARPQRLPSGIGENAGTLGPEREARPGPGHTGRPLGPSSRRRLCPALPGDPARPASSVRALAPVPGALSSPVSLSLRRPIHPCPPPTASPTARATARWHRLWPLEKGRGLSGTCLQVRGHLEDLPRGPRLVTLRSREAAPCPAPTSQLRRVDLDFSQKRKFPWSQQPRRQKLVTAPVPKPQGPSESPAEPS